jgi:uncharacterized protein (TIGR02145 family)
MALPIYLISNNRLTFESSPFFGDNHKIYFNELELGDTIKYGALYNWYAVTDVRNIANTGWSVPLMTEYQTLYGFLGAVGFQHKVKEATLSYWLDITSVTNSAKFNGRGVGYRLIPSGQYGGLKQNLRLACINGTNLAILDLTSGASNASITTSVNKAHGVSLRLKKDITSLSDGEESTYTGNDGKIYRTICIGTQEWLADNLFETKFRNNYPKYGYLYNWWAATDVRNITNTDWHIPTSTELYNLMRYIDPTGIPNNNIASKHLKETGTIYWDSPNNGLNTYGFNARGSGYRIYSNGVYSELGEYLRIWTSNSVSASNASVGQVDSVSDIFYMQYSIYNSNYPKSYGFSIRLVKDSTSLLDGEEGTYTGNDGKVYRTICIGNQEWLADNLAETKFRNGESLTKVIDDSAWAALTTEGYCAYDNDENYVMLGQYIHGYENGVYTTISNANWASLTTDGICIYNDDENNA